MMIIYRSIYVRYHAHNPLDSISKVFITDFIDQYNTGITSLIIMLYRACNSFSLPRESTNFLYYRENYSLLSFQYQYRTRYIDSSNRFAGNSSFCTPYKSRGFTCPRYFLLYYGSIERESMIFSPHACVQWFYYTRYNRINLAIVDQRFCKHRRIIYANGKGWIKEVGWKSRTWNWNSIFCTLLVPSVLDLNAF